MSEKMRLDKLMVIQGLAPSRTRAQAMIEEGLVYLQDRRLEKPGEVITCDQKIMLHGLDHPWVSRGGLKLQHAFEQFKLSSQNLVCLDIGASTGGFTDVLLHHGARKIYAVDVGHGQLAEKLRLDNRVISIEGKNARALTPHDIPEQADIIVCDASFIALEIVLKVPLTFAAPHATLVALVKPQFEVGKENLGKGGVVKNPAFHRFACDKVTDWINAQPEWQTIALTDSPIKGPAGNKEFLIMAQKGQHDCPSPSRVDHLHQV